MADVTLPAPIALAGAGLCLLAGFLVGAVAGPETATPDTATVVEFDAKTNRLCLTGDAVDDQEATRDGVLCGEWRRMDGTPDPEEGDDFRFATLSSNPGDEGDITTLIYGDVVR